MPAYAPHLQLSAPARLSADLPRLVLGVVLIELGYGVALNLVDALLLALPEAEADAFYQGSSRMGLTLQLFSFAGLALAVMLVTRKLHLRPILSLFGPPDAALWALRRTTLACLAGFALIEVLPPYYSYAGSEWNLPLTWLLLMPLSLLAILVQTGAEELLYRGYLQQQLAARFSHPLIWMLVPNLFFAAAHWDPSATQAAALDYVTWAFFFGLAASDLTARSGNLGAAIGFHLANNAFAFLFFAERGGTDSGLALILFPASPDLPASAAADPGFPSTGLVLELSVILILWLCARIAIKR